VGAPGLICSCVYACVCAHVHMGCVCLGEENNNGCCWVRHVMGSQACNACAFAHMPQRQRIRMRARQHLWPSIRDPQPTCGDMQNVGAHTHTHAHTLTRTLTLWTGTAVTTNLAARCACPALHATPAGAPLQAPA